MASQRFRNVASPASQPPYLPNSLLFKCFLRSCQLFHQAAHPSNHYLRKAVPFLPWILLSLLCAFLASQILWSTRRIRFVPFVLTSTLVPLSLYFSFHYLLPRVQEFRTRKSMEAREKRRRMDLELAKWRKEAVRKCRNCKTPYQGQPTPDGRFLCSVCGHWSKRPVVEIPEISSQKNVAQYSRSFNMMSDGLAKANGFLLNTISSIARFPASPFLFFSSLFGHIKSKSWKESDKRQIGMEKVGFSRHRIERTKRKAVEKRQARLEREKNEEEERKQRKEVERLVEEERKRKENALKTEIDIDREVAVVKEREWRRDRVIERRHRWNQSSKTNQSESTKDPDSEKDKQKTENIHSSDSSFRPSCWKSENLRSNTTSTAKRNLNESFDPNHDNHLSNPQSKGSQSSSSSSSSGLNYMFPMNKKIAGARSQGKPIGPVTQNAPLKYNMGFLRPTLTKSTFDSASRTSRISVHSGSKPPMSNLSKSKVASSARALPEKSVWGSSAWATKGTTNQIHLNNPPETNIATGDEKTSTHLNQHKSKPGVDSQQEDEKNYEKKQFIENENEMKLERIDEKEKLTSSLSFLSPPISPNSIPPSRCEQIIIPSSVDPPLSPPSTSPSPSPPPSVSSFHQFFSFPNDSWRKVPNSEEHLNFREAWPWHSSNPIYSSPNPISSYGEAHNQLFLQPTGLDTCFGSYPPPVPTQTYDPMKSNNFCSIRQDLRVEGIGASFLPGSITSSWDPMNSGLEKDKVWTQVSPAMSELDKSNSIHTINDSADQSKVDENDIPPEFIDCITHQVMSDPVITADGHSYERSAIEFWLRFHDTSPITGKVLPPPPRQGVIGSERGVDKSLRPNHILRSQIMQYNEKFSQNKKILETNVTSNNNESHCNFPSSTPISFSSTMPPLTCSTPSVPLLSPLSLSSSMSLSSFLSSSFPSSSSSILSSLSSPNSKKNPQSENFDSIAHYDHDMNANGQNYTISSGPFSMPGNLNFWSYQT